VKGGSWSAIVVDVEGEKIWRERWRERWNKYP